MELKLTSGRFVRLKMLGIFTILLAVASVFLLFYYLCKIRYNYWKKRNVLCPPPLPILGNYGDYILLKKYVGLVQQDICRKFPNAPYIGAFYGTQPTLIVQDPELLKLVMTKDFYYFSSREITDYTDRETFTTNIFFSGGDHWRVVRQNMTPLFSSAKMKAMFYLLENCCYDFESMLAKNLTCNKLEAKSLMARFTISNIGSCAFGIDMQTLNTDSMDLKENPFYKIGRAVFESSNYRGFKTVARAIWPAIFYGLGCKSFPTSIDDFFLNFLTAVFKERDYKPSSRNDFVDLFLTFKEKKILTGDSLSNMKNNGTLKVKVPVDDRLLVAQCITVFAGGYETSSATLSFTLYELAKNQEAQKRAQAEIDAFLQRHDNRLSYDCMHELPYLDACIYETLRIYPVLGSLTREVVEDYTLPSGLYLEKGLRIHLPIYHLHHNPDYFPDPHEYKPERFLPENAHNIKPYTFFPFGGGPRLCIGSRFAKMQIFPCLVTLLKRYHLQLADGTPARVELDPRVIVTQPLQELWLQCHDRPGWEQRVFKKTN